MKRTPAWVFVAAAMVQFAGLGLCVWAMERHVRDADDGTTRPVLAPPAPDPLVNETASAAPLPPQPRQLAEVPPFLAQAVDASTMFLQGTSSGRSVLFACYPDGKMRFVDIDGSCYEGTSEGSRARMREVGGTRAFTVRIAALDARRHEATFTGGQHDDATIALEERVGRSNV
jgi:hypothetical protein